MSNSTVMAAREVVETDRVTHAGDGFLRGAVDGVVTQVRHDTGIVYLWVDEPPKNRPADLILNHGDPVRVQREPGDPLVEALTWEGDGA